MADEEGVLRRYKECLNMPAIETPELHAEREYYDQAYSQRLQWYDCDPEMSQFFPIWKRMVELSEGRILDIGCGVGQAAQLIRQMGRPYVCGVDYSKVAIEQACARNPGLTFVCDDLFAQLRKADHTTYDTIFAAEVLEHIRDDMGLLNLIWPGKQVVFSVPTISAIGHERHYPDMESVLTRFQGVLNIRSIEVVGWVFVVSGRKR